MGLTLVTGGTGYLGQRLIDSLLADGALLRALVYSDWKGEELEEKGVEVVYGDVTEAETLIDDHLKVPFATVVLSVDVKVTGVELTEREEIVAVCVRGKQRQRIPICDLPLPSPPPSGAEWIEAYRHWAASG